MGFRRTLADFLFYHFHLNEEENLLNYCTFQVKVPIIMSKMLNITETFSHGAFCLFFWSVYLQQNKDRSKNTEQFAAVTIKQGLIPFSSFDKCGIFVSILSFIFMISFLTCKKMHFCYCKPNYIMP